MAEHPRIDLTTAEGPFVPGRYMAEKPRFRFVEPTIAPVVAPPKYREEPRLRVVAPRLGLARMSTGLAVSLGMLAVFAVIGVGGLLTRPDAPEIAALPAEPPATADPSPAAPPRVAQLPSLPPEALAVPPVRPAAPEVGEARAFPRRLRAAPDRACRRPAAGTGPVGPAADRRPGRGAAPRGRVAAALAAPRARRRPRRRRREPSFRAGPVAAPAAAPRGSPPGDARARPDAAARLAPPEGGKAWPQPTLDILPPAAASGCPSSLSRGMPRRSARAETGSQLAASL
ncbi:MAG: hypothetical protein ACE368_10535 [Paracoccaceae bacterium]